MSLVGRVTAFFLIALALVLAGYSTSLYLLARSYLHRQVEDRLEAALDTLTASAELTPEGVEWDAQRDRLSLGQDADEAQVRWQVSDEQGKVIDHSRNLGEEGLGETPSWRLRQRTLQSASTPLTGVPPGKKAKDEEHDPKYPLLILRVGVSLRPMRGTLRTLALALPGLSLAVWLLAAGLGRRVCQRALVPVSHMAATARTITAADLGQRLPVMETGDDLAELGAAFNELLSRLQEAFERQRRFTGDASHQLRTPLAVMLGQVEVALRQDRPTEEYRRVLGIVAEQSGRLGRIVEMLLFLARADTEAVLPGRARVAIGPWVQDHLRDWAAHPRAADLRVQASASAPLFARVHEALLGQVVDILLDNACKYSPAGTPILVALQDEGEQVTLVVEDQGCGMEPSDLSRIFDPFYRSPRLGRLGVGGVGLGLAIAQRVMSAMDGAIEVHSTLGQGSRFVVRLSN